MGVTLKEIRDQIVRIGHQKKALLATHKSELSVTVGWPSKYIRVPRTKQEQYADMVKLHLMVDKLNTLVGTRKMELWFEAHPPVTITVCDVEPRQVCKNTLAASESGPESVRDLADPAYTPKSYGGSK